MIELTPLVCVEFLLLSCEGRRCTGRRCEEQEVLLQQNCDQHLSEAFGVSSIEV